MKKLNLVLFAFAVLTTGCFSEIRASSREQPLGARSKMTLDASPEDGCKLLVESFTKRGFQLVDRSTPSSGGVQCIFKGGRTDYTTVSGNRYGTYGSTNKIGSIFYARLKPVAEGKTRLSLFGKPTLDGNPVCSDFDQSYGVTCHAPVSAGIAWPGRNQMTGNEEAETIRSVILELVMAGKGQEENPSSAQDGAPPSTPTSKCDAANLPEWQTANAATKKRMLEECRAKNPAPAPSGEEE